MPGKSRAERARLEMLGRVGRVSGAGSTGRYGEKSRAAQAAPAAILAVVVALGVGLGVLHNRWGAKGRPDPALAGIRTAAYPFQLGAARTSGAARTGWSWVFPGKDLGAENAKLSAEVARLRQENEELRGAADEAARLRDALQFSRAKAQPPQLAEVIGLLPSPVFDSIIVGKGSRDGVRPKAVARTAAGLIGQVTEVGPLTCQVMLLSDANAQVGGVVMRGGKRMGSGIVRGQGRFEPLQMVYLRRDDDIKPGDKVVSSGYGGVFPAGASIGTVLAVTEEKQGYLKSATIEPAAPMPGDLREVFLLPVPELPAAAVPATAAAGERPKR